MRLKAIVVSLMMGLVCVAQVRGEAILQLFNLTWNQISDKMPEIAEAGYTGLWLPPPTKSSSQFSAGYDVFNPFDLGDLNEKGTIPTRYGTKEELLRLMRIAHRFGIRVYFDNIMNHRAFDTPGYDEFTAINVYPGTLPEDFHLQTTSDGFYRKWPDSCFCSVPSTQLQGFSSLCDYSQEDPNYNFNLGPNLYTTSPKFRFIRQPNNPEYYMDGTQPAINGQTGATFWHPFNGTNGTPSLEDTGGFIIRGTMWLMDQTKCDGFRLDAVKHLPSYFFGDYLSATPNGYDGAIQTIFDAVHGYGYSNSISGYNEGDDNRNSCYDTEAIRNDAVMWGEHIAWQDSNGNATAEPFDAYYNRGMRLLDINLHNNMNNILGSPDNNSLSGYDSRDAGGFNSYDREMFCGTHDPGVVYVSQFWMQNAFFFMREGLPSVYSDGFYESANCNTCGGAFPAIAYARYLGEFGDNYTPELAYLHNQVARGGTFGRWSDKYTAAFERYDYREGSGASSQVVMLFAMNDKQSFPGDIAFLDGIGDSWPGSDPSPPGANNDPQGLAVDFPVGSVLYLLSPAAPAANRAYQQITVRQATNVKSNAINSGGSIVYVGGQGIPAGGGGVEFIVPSGSYVIYGYQGPQASRAGLKDAITIQQNGQDVPRINVQRTDGPNGDSGFNPIYPFQRRGSVDQSGNTIQGQNTSNFTYTIDIPVVTNNAPMNIVLRTDASATNALVKLDGGVDVNSQMGLGPTNQHTGILTDLRDNRPGYAYDMFLGYEQALFQFRYGPEKFAAADISRNVVVSLGAETYLYNIGGSSSINHGGGPNTSTATANWVYHNPSDTSQPVGPMLTNTPGGVVLWAKVGYASQISSGTVYYTVYPGSGSTNYPEGSFGVPKPGTMTQVMPLKFDHTSSGGDGTYDWWKATITNAPSGTLIYKLALFNNNIAPISDADSAKLYGVAQFTITNFNPATALVWVHDDLNTNSTQIGLDPGYHMLRLRSFLPRAGRSSIFNTFSQSFYYDPQTPLGVIAFPTNDGDTLGSQTYGVVVRVQDTATEVDYNIADQNPNNDDGATGQINGNGNGSNSVPSWAVATQISPDPTLGAQYPNKPKEFRFNYVGIPNSGTATINVRIKDSSSTQYTNRYTLITRLAQCAAPAQVLHVAFPHNNDQIFLDQNSAYQIVFCYTSSLGNNANNFTIKIDGAVQPRTTADGTALYLFQGSFCGSGTSDLRYNWGGMSAGHHTIEITYNDGVISLYDSVSVNVSLTGISVNITNPPAADPVSGASPDTIVINTCGGGTTIASTNVPIVVQTSSSVTNVLITFINVTNAFSGGLASLDTNFVGTVSNGTAGLSQWIFAWTNVIKGTWTFRADGLGGGSNSASRTVAVVLRQIEPTSLTSDDSDNDGISDYLESNHISLPGGSADQWSNGQVHVWYFSGRTNPNSPDSDADGLPDGLELGIGPLPAATGTVSGADANCGTTNFIVDVDPPVYNTFDNATRPAGYEGFEPWSNYYNANKSRTDQIAGTVTDPNNSDTDNDGIQDGIEDINHNGRVEIGLTNSAGAVTNVIAHPPTVYNTSIIDRVKVLQIFPNALWLETDPNNSDTDGDGLSDGFENGGHNGYMKIGLLNRNIGYAGADCGCVTGSIAMPLPSSILYMAGTSRVNRKALIQQYPNAVLLETDPMDAHTDGDPNGLPDGWKVQYGLDPWDDGMIGHTNWHSGALITTTRNGAQGNPSGDGISNMIKYLNGLNPLLYYSNNVPVITTSLPLDDGPVIGTTAGTTWKQEFQGWSVNDLRVVRPYDGIGPNSLGHTIYPYDNLGWSRDMVAFYTHDGGSSGQGGDGNYYFRIDLHDLDSSAEGSDLVSFYVAINVGLPGTGQTTFPENISATTDMGWHLLIGIYGNGANNPQGLVYTNSLTNPIGFQGPGGVINQFWRGDLDSVVFAIPRQTLLNAGWSGITPLSFQVFDTAGGNWPGGDLTRITDTIYDNGITESMNPGYGTVLHYWFTSVNQNAINLSAYQGNASILSQTNRPNVAKVAIVLHGNQSILPTAIIQNLVSNGTTRTPSGVDATYDPGKNPVGYYRPLESAQLFGLPLNLHLSGSLISGLQWAKSDPALDPTGSRDGAKFNQRITSMIASGQVSLVSGMFADHIAPYFTGAVNRAGIQLQDDIMRTVYGSNSVSANTPLWLAEQAANGPLMSDLAANSGHNLVLLNQLVHLWWWGDQIYGQYNGRPAALQDGGFQINRFNGMKTFLISGESSQMYSIQDLGCGLPLRELLMKKALDGTRDQVVILADNWENAGGIGGNSNPDNLNLVMRWIANHQWIKPVRLDQFGNAQVDINNDGTVNGSDTPSVQDRGSANFSMLAKDFVHHSSETNLNNWYYGSSREESFFSRRPMLRNDQSVTTSRSSGNEVYNGTNAVVWGGKILGHVQTNGTILADTWADLQTITGGQTNLNKLAQLVYLNGIFETAFHDEDNGDITRFSTGVYTNPDVTTDLLSPFALKGAARATRQADIIAYAAFWASSNPSVTTTAIVADVEQTGDPSHNYILSNNRVYAVFERVGGKLVAAFARDPHTGTAYQIIGSLASTPEFESEREGDINMSGSPLAPVAYRTSAFKDWYAVGPNTNQYVNDYYSVTNAPTGTGWQFTSSDGKLTKTITLASDSTKLEAGYTLNGLVAVFVRSGLSPDALNLLYQGQANLQGPSTNNTGQVLVRNVNPSAVAQCIVAYNDSASHSNMTYNPNATDDGGSTNVFIRMRDQAQTQQIELEGFAPAFSFALDLNAVQGDSAPNGDGISNYQASQLGADPFNPFDTNGLTTAWELKYFGTSNVNANADSDGDGLSNLQEFMAGTDPTNSTSTLRILSITPVANGKQITWSSISGKVYEVLATTNLSIAYAPIGTNTASSATSSFTDSTSPGAPKFYKVHLLQ